MTRTRMLRTILPLAALAVVLLATETARASWLGDWFGWDRPTTVTAGYYYVPETSYRTLYAPVAVTSYSPAPACGACGSPVTAYMPVTTYVQRPIVQTYTSYRLISAPIVAPACGACATAYYPPACGACGSSACGCATGGCATGGCATGACPSCGCASGGCAACGYAPAPCSACGGGCASGACGSGVALVAPAYPAAAISAPAMAYMPANISAPITSTPYVPTAVTAYPAAGPAQVYAAPAATYPITATYGSPTIVAAPPTAAGATSPTYAMPIPPNAAAPNFPPNANSVVQPGTPTIAPPAGGPSSADVAPSLPGPVPPASNNQPRSSNAPEVPANPPLGARSDAPKTFAPPAASPPAPTTLPMKPIPDARGSTSPNSSNSPRPIDPNSRTAYTMPMLRPGTHFSTPWPIAKTTAALMPIVPSTPANANEADGWHAVQ